MAQQDPRHSTPITAGVFHVGNTCPRCQETIAAGQLIVICVKCGSIHHDTCYAQKNGCSSYHCDTAVNVPSAQVQADIVIRPEELERVVPPPPRAARDGLKLAQEYLPPPPSRLSRMALLSAVCAGLALAGIFGICTSNLKAVTLGIALSLGALASGVLALLFISNAQNRLSGFRVAVSGTVLPAILMVVYFGYLNRYYTHTAFQEHTNLKLSQSRPSEDQLARMPLAIANGMRANVVVTSSNSLLNSSYGSGVIVRVAGNDVWILTNKHVIGDHNGGIHVMFYTGEESVAQRVWQAPEDVDLAVIACTSFTLQHYVAIKLSSTLANSGDKVFAIGNPLELAWSYTEGIVSSTRTQGTLDVYQTQTPINSGNSGGGLYSADGTLIGINTWTKDKSVAEGLNFSIATSCLLQMLDAPQKQQFFGQQ